MTIGLGVFIASVVLGTVFAVISCRHTWRWHGSAAAAREAVVLALSLAVFTGICLWHGYSAGTQFLAWLGSAVPLLIGAIFVPSIRDQFRGNS